MKRAILGIGIPGSGKTTYLKVLAGEHDWSYLNRDDLRAEITGDPRDHTREPLVQRLSQERMRQGLAERGTVVIDETHSKRRDRRETIAFLREAGAEELVAYLFDVPLDVALERNAARERPVPAEAIERMHRRLTLNPPSLEEGFDRIEVLGERSEPPR